MQNYKLNSPAPHTILNYIQQQFNKKHDFYYNFLEESDPTTLKVLIQILYEQIESQCINLAIRDQEAHKRQVGVENIHPDRLADRQHKDAELKYHLKEFEDTHGLEREKLRLEMEDQTLRCQNFETQLKRKNNLVNRLFDDRSLFVKSFDKQTGVLVRGYQFLMRYAQDTKDVYTKEVLKIQQPNSFIAQPESQSQAEKLSQEISSVTKFLFWAKDYEKIDDKKYFNDQDFERQMAKEKSEYSDMFMGQFEDGKQSFQDILEDVDKSKEIISQLKGQIQVLTSENQNNNARVDQGTAYLQKRLTDKDLEVKQLIELNQKKDRQIQDFDNTGRQLKESLLKHETIEDQDFFFNFKDDGRNSDFLEALQILNDILKTGGKNITENQIQALEGKNPKMKYILRGIKEKDNVVIEKLDKMKGLLKEFELGKLGGQKELANVYE